MTFVPGDIVTRDGSDEHVVIDGDDICVLVRCVKAPTESWCSVGDEEDNLTRRYELVRHADGSK